MRNIILIFAITFMSATSIVDKAHFSSQIVVKEKSTENTLFLFDKPTTIECITSLMKPTKEEHVIYEDENHNALSSQNLVPPMVVFVCKFIPQNKNRKRRNVVNAIETAPVIECKNHDILI